MEWNRRRNEWWLGPQAQSSRREFRRRGSCTERERGASENCGARAELRRQSLPLGVEVQVVQPVAVHDALIQSNSSREVAIQLGNVHNEVGDGNGTTHSCRARRANCVDDASVAAGRGISTGAVDVGRSNIDGRIGDNDFRKADRLISW